MQYSEKSNTRDVFINILQDENPQLLFEEHIEKIHHSLHQCREKEKTEMSRTHFLELYQLLYKCQYEYKEVFSTLNVQYKVEKGCVKIFAEKAYEKFKTENHVADAPLFDAAMQTVNKMIHHLSPWRKGPFNIFGTHIDAEWRSALKWSRIQNICDIDELCKDKLVLDVGCNNMYYSFTMATYNPKLILAIDPTPRYAFYAHLFSALLSSLPFFYEMWKIEDCNMFPQSFDTIFCMGILYHQRNPLAMLATLRALLRKKGVLVLETICLNNKNPYCLVPNERYQKARGYWFIPSIQVLETWLQKTGFEIVGMNTPVKTNLNEQRKTEWVSGESLEHFLSQDGQTTVEGHPPPYRVCVVARVKH